ncbi:hypothetical protein ABT255_61520 [Streptomyces mirabilis]|uniref:hypothetical protein n=1 Tax=Streptomyces mirabilis TaxID=68239 RepID=UPI00331E21EA
MEVFPEETIASFEISGTGTRLSIPELILDNSSSVWWRRPGRFQISAEISEQEISDFCYGECDAMIRGSFMASDVVVINDPLIQKRASYKPLQLSVARRLGLSVPATLMTNDPRAVVEFRSQVGACVFKPFRSFPGGFLETRAMDDDALSDLAALKYAPIIIQQKVAPASDIRVNVFGEDVYAARAVLSHPGAALDWRLDPAVHWQSCDLPKSLVDRILRLVSVLGLHYGCIDMRLTPDGEYYFLEINPAGQFLFIEIQTEQPLSLAMAKLLLDTRVRSDRP